MPGTTTYGIPIGEFEPGGQTPDPKSAWTMVLAPMALMYAAELESTGRLSIGVFQMSSSGRTSQPPKIGGAAGAARVADTPTIKIDSDRHVLVVRQGECKLYELYHAFPNSDGSWNADSGAVYTLTLKAGQTAQAKNFGAVR